MSDVLAATVEVVAFAVVSSEIEAVEKTFFPSVVFLLLSVFVSGIAAGAVAVAVDATLDAAAVAVCVVLFVALALTCGLEFVAVKRMGFAAVGVEGGAGPYTGCVATEADVAEVDAEAVAVALAVLLAFALKIKVGL